jgi:plastocyanin
LGTTREIPRQRWKPAGAALLLAATVGLLTAGSSEPESQPDRTPTPSSSGLAGSIRGTVRVGPELNAQRARFSLYPDVHATTTPRVTSVDDELSNVVVYLESETPSTATAPRMEHAGAIEQRGERFVPHLLVVQRGSAVDFPNGDVVFHNVFSLSKSASFDLGRYPRGDSRSVRFDKAGIVKVFCHIHPDMSAVILVLDNPYFATPDATGAYEIPGVPPGTYTLTAWHERAHPIKRRIVLLPGQTAEQHFAIPLQDTLDGG